MLESVPITIGGENHTLLFTPLDVDNIEQDRNLPLINLIAGNQIKRIGTLAAFLHFGLKKGTDSRGNPIRELPQTAEGRDQARELVRLYLQGRDAFTLIDLGNTVFSALAAAEWFNLKEIQDEASASVPQAVEPPKNSEGPGSKRTKK
jgi:hypothetical protein